MLISAVFVFSSGPDLIVRAATPNDAKLLANFRCSTGVACEDEVEYFINTRLSEWTFTPTAATNDPRTLLVFREGNDQRLVAVGSHEVLSGYHLESQPLEGTKVEVLAVAIDERGAQHQGRRIGDLAFHAMLADIDSRPQVRGRLLLGVVANDNSPSKKFCDRNGLGFALPYSDGYELRIGQRPI